MHLYLGIFLKIIMIWYVKAGQDMHEEYESTSKFQRWDQTKLNGFVTQIKCKDISIYKIRVLYTIHFI